MKNNVKAGNTARLGPSAGNGAKVQDVPNVKDANTVANATKGGVLNTGGMGGAQDMAQGHKKIAISTDDFIQSGLASGVKRKSNS